MKKIIILILTIIFTLSCSKDDNGPIKGCMDPSAVNYNSAAVENDGSCQYSVLGNWQLTKYTWGSTNILSGYQYLYMDINSNGTTKTHGRLNDGTDIEVLGTATIGGTNNSVITFTNSSGDVSVFTVTSISSTNLKMTSQLKINNETATAIIEAKRI